MICHASGRLTACLRPFLSFSLEICALDLALSSLYYSLLQTASTFLKLFDSGFSLLQVTDYRSRVTITVYTVPGEEELGQPLYQVRYSFFFPVEFILEKRVSS
jgi:hypothetical protein